MHGFVTDVQTEFAIFSLGDIRQKKVFLFVVGIVDRTMKFAFF